MSLSKLKKLHVIIIGSVLCALVGALMGMFLVKPEFVNYNEQYQRWLGKIPPGTEELAARDMGAAFAKPLADAQADLQLANMEKIRAQQNLDAQMELRMPKLDFSNREAGMIALWHEQILKLGPMLESFAQDKNVEVLNSGFVLPPPPANPNDAVFSQDILVFPLGTVAVQGDFKSIMKNIRRWNNCRRLIMVSPPVLQGTSPRLQAAYTVTCYIYPIAKGGDPVPMAGGGTAGGQMGAPAPM